VASLALAEPRRVSRAKRPACRIAEAGADLYTLHEHALAELQPDLVTAAGGLPVAACPGKPSVPVSWGGDVACRSQGRPGVRSA
jgi:hypothetical protein